METESFGQLSIDEFLHRLASDSPTPGGGSVAALTGSLAAGLGRMACALTPENPKFPAVNERISETAQRLERAGQMLHRLMDEDATAYDELRAALKLDKSNPERSRQIRQAATLSAEVPLETAAIAQRVLRDLSGLTAIANPNLKSDLMAGLYLALTASLAAGAIVNANLALMDEKAASELEQQLNQMLSGND